MTKSLILLLLLLTFQCFANPDLYQKQWMRNESNDGYVLGNGKMYVVAGLGLELTRKGKTDFCGERCSLSKIGWVIGPSYALGNLGHGWDIVPVIDSQRYKWENEKIMNPAGNNGFWGVRGDINGISYTILDLLDDKQSHLIRKVVVKNNAELGKDLELLIPVNGDVRNCEHQMFNGIEIDTDQILQWSGMCGPNLKLKPSIDSAQVKEIISENVIILRAAPRSLWQDNSTRIPDDRIYNRIFRSRVAVTTISAVNAKVETEEDGFRIDFGEIGPDQSREFYIHIYTSFANNGIQERSVVSKMEKLAAQDYDTRFAPTNDNSRLIVFDSDYNGMLDRILDASYNLSISCHSEMGGVMAQPYMYPLYYVRDQYGSVRLFTAVGDHKRLKDILDFYITQQNREGIQNAYNPLHKRGNPMKWDSMANERNGEHQKAEVPSYIVLFAKEYYNLTSDLNTIKYIYPRLAYNIRIQHKSRNGILPYAGDESYTNFKETVPQFHQEMTDSHLLYISAVEFMCEMAKKLNKEKDEAEFAGLARQAREDLAKRMWNSEGKYFIYARSDNDNDKEIDFRPAFDPLMRWNYLELGYSPNDTVSTGCMNMVLSRLVNPIRVVPEHLFATGSEPGYLLYAMSRMQHPLTHQAAELLARYSSANGLMSEFYSYNNEFINPLGGVTRPWESSVCAYAIYQYLTGLRLDMPDKKISFQPHLPADCNGWKSNNIDMDAEGVIWFELKKEGSLIRFLVSRKGGESPLGLNVEFGLFGNNPTPVSGNLKISPDKEILVSQDVIAPAKEISKIEFTFEIQVPD